MRNVGSEVRDCIIAYPHKFICRGVKFEDYQKILGAQDARPHGEDLHWFLYSPIRVCFKKTDSQCESAWNKL